MGQNPTSYQGRRVLEVDDKKKLQDLTRTHLIYQVRGRTKIPPLDTNVDERGQRKEWGYGRL